MKLLALILALAFVGGRSYATVPTQHTDKLMVVKQDHKKEIRVDELPEEVSQSIKDSDYQDWTIDKVYLLETDQTTTYELHVSLDNETKVLIVNSEGVLQLKTDV